MLFRCQWALIFVLFCSLSFAESITLQTYYPAPQGNYRSMRSGKICIGETCQTGDSQAQSGTLFAEKGVQLGTDAGGCDEKNLGRIFYSLDERAVMICTADEDDEYFWRQLGRGAVSEILMGRAISSENFIDWMHHETQDYFEPKRQHPSEYYFCSWQGTGLVKGEGDLLKITEISLQQEPRQGNYFVLYGGGQMEFHTGVEYTVTLNLITDMTHNEERNVDSFTLRSDGAIGEISMVDFPKRRVDG